MRSGRVCVFVIFVLNGGVAGAWAPRMPTIAEQIGATPGELGLALLGANLGLATAASFAGRLCARHGAPAIVLSSVLLAAAVLPVLALVTSPLQLGLLLVLLGASFGLFDVSMNVAAVTVVRAEERPLMPVFHAGFSFGALAASLCAALAAVHHLSLLPYFVTAALVLLAVIAVVIRSVPREQPAAGTGSAPNHGMLRRPVLWLLGGIAFLAAIVEGSSYDWSALFAVRERGMSEASGAVLFSVFCGVMGMVRLSGERVQSRFGAVRILAVGSILTGIGLLMAATVPTAWATFAGYILAGAGVAFAFPVVLDLAGAVGQRSDGSGGEREIGLVTTIAYSGFLIGPPMVGGIAQLTGLSFAIGCVGVIATLIAPTALASAYARRREAPATGTVRIATGQEAVRR